MVAAGPLSRSFPARSATDGGGTTEMSAGDPAPQGPRPRASGLGAVSSAGRVTKEDADHNRPRCFAAPGINPRSRTISSTPKPHKAGLFGIHPYPAHGNEGALQSQVLCMNELVLPSTRGCKVREPSFSPQHQGTNPFPNRNKMAGRPVLSVPWKNHKRSIYTAITQ
jgi:hypothetical protein